MLSRSIEMSSTDQLRSFGEIHFIRKSVQRALQSIGQNSQARTSSSASSSSSSCTSSKSSKERPKPRPCLYWDNSDGYDVVLLMASFNGLDPLVEKDKGQSIVPNVTHEVLVKHLVSLSPTSPVPGRRCITLKGSDSNEELIDQKKNFFLILKPVLADEKTNWGRKYDGLFSDDDLWYIRQLLWELDEEKFKRKMLEFKHSPTKRLSTSTESNLPTSRNIHTDTMVLNQSIHDDNDEVNTSTSSNINLLNEMKVNKLDLVQQWINGCEDLTEVIQDAYDPCLFDK